MPSPSDLNASLLPHFGHIALPHQLHFPGLWYEVIEWPRIHCQVVADDWEPPLEPSKPPTRDPTKDPTDPQKFDPDDDFGCDGVGAGLTF